MEIQRYQIHYCGCLPTTACKQLHYEKLRHRHHAASSSRAMHHRTITRQKKTFIHFKNGEIHFNTFQYISIHFNIFQYILIHFDTFQYISIHFNTFQYISIHFNTFQYISIHFNTFQYISNHFCTRALHIIYGQWRRNYILFLSNSKHFGLHRFCLQH